MNRETQIQVRFRGSEVFPAILVASVIRHIDVCALEAEREDFRKLLSILRAAPASIKADLRKRLERYPATAFHIRTASSGSLVLEGFAAAVFEWILKGTIGETLKKAWLKSNAHRRLEKFLSKSRGTKARRIKRKLQRKKTKMWPGTHAKISIKTIKNGVSVDVYFKGGNLAPGRTHFKAPAKGGTPSSTGKQGTVETRDLSKVPTIDLPPVKSSDLPVEGDWM